MYYYVNMFYRLLKHIYINFFKILAPQKLPIVLRNQASKQAYSIDRSLFNILQSFVDECRLPQPSAVRNSVILLCFKPFSMEKVCCLLCTCVKFWLKQLHVTIVTLTEVIITSVSSMSICFCHRYGTGWSTSRPTLVFSAAYLLLLLVEIFPSTQVSMSGTTSRVQVKKNCSHIEGKPNICGPDRNISVPVIALPRLQLMGDQLPYFLIVATAWDREGWNLYENGSEIQTDSVQGAFLLPECIYVFS